VTSLLGWHRAEAVASPSADSVANAMSGASVPLSQEAVVRGKSVDSPRT
jgi:hypothetical protein